MHAYDPVAGRETTRTLSERLYRDLRASILSLALKPGDVIHMNAIAEKLGVSRSPIRDALMKLDKEGLVEIMPQKGTCVSQIDLSRMHEERFLRQSLEEPTLKLFIQCAAPAHLGRLEENLAKQKRTLGSGDATTFLDLDDAFHHTIFEGAERSMCWEVIRSMSGHYRRVRLLALRSLGILNDLYDQHRHLYQCAHDRNTSAARALIRSHLFRVLVEEKELMAEFPSYFVARRSRDHAFAGVDV